MKRLRIRWQMVIALLIILIGAGGQFVYDFYIRPYVLAVSVVKIRVNTGEYLPKNTVLTHNDLYIDKVSVDALPKGYLLSIDQAIGKITQADLSDGTILTSWLIDLDDIHPDENEGIFPIPSGAIVAVNGSLRNRDLVNIYLFREEDQADSADLFIAEHDPILTNVKVVHVRSSENNDVKDTETGNITNRETSTSGISSLEVKLSLEDGERIKNMIAKGYKLWIVRVS